MAKQPDRQTLFAFADDGKLFHRKLKARLDYLGVSMNVFCASSGVSFSTTDRWRTGSNPLGATIRVVEDALLTLEHNQVPIRDGGAADGHIVTHSSIDVPMPSASL